MRNLGWLVVALALAAGCKKKEQKTPPAPTPASGSVVAQPDPGSGSAPDVGSAGSGSGASESGYKMTKESNDPPRPDTSGFKPLDERVAGTTPWLSDEDAKLGFVELVADDDLSGKTKGTFTTKRLCGDAAKKAIAKYAEVATKRAADKSYEQTDCHDSGSDPDRTLCLTDAHGEGDFVLLLDFRKRGDRHALAGLHYAGVGIDIEKQSAEYDKLMTTKCK